MKISGSALYDGILLQAGNSIVITRRKLNNEIDIKIIKNYKKESVENYIRDTVKKIPLIRGIYNLFFIDGNKLLWFFMGIIILLDILGLFNLNTQNSLLYLGINKFYIISTIIFFAFIIWKLKSFLQYHGAEHKVINAYENNIFINVDEIRKCSRINYRCGTIFAIFLITCFIISKLILDKYTSFISVQLLFGIGLAEELYLSKILYNIGFKYLFVIGGYIQKYLTTMEPTNEQIEIGIVCLNKLLEIEND